MRPGGAWRPPAPPAASRRASNGSADSHKKQVVAIEEVEPLCDIRRVIMNNIATYATCNARPMSAGADGMPMPMPGQNAMMMRGLLISDAMR